MKHLTSKQFFNLLRRRTRANAAAIDRRIEASGLEEWTMLMSDSSGFSRKTHEHGILQFLAVMTQCYDRLIPLLEKRRGLVIAHNADNIVAIFKHPADAVAAAIDMHEALRRRNRRRPPREQFNICIGINTGAVIRLADNVYGAPVNVAAKMGEDLAGRDEILVTRPVVAAVKGRFKTAYVRSTELGGRTFELFRVNY